MHKVNKTEKIVIAIELAERKRLIHLSQSSGLTLSDFIRYHLKHVTGMNTYTSSQ